MNKHLYLHIPVLFFSPGFFYFSKVKLNVHITRINLIPNFLHLAQVEKNALPKIKFQHHWNFTYLCRVLCLYLHEKVFFQAHPPKPRHEDCSFFSHLPSPICFHIMCCFNELLKLSNFIFTPRCFNSRGKGARKEFQLLL
jgi:hypothetical protein